jgi:hypothetical protein
MSFQLGSDLNLPRGEWYLIKLNFSYLMTHGTHNRLKNPARNLIFLVNVSAKLPEVILNNLTELETSMTINFQALGLSRPGSSIKSPSLSRPSTASQRPSTASSCISNKNSPKLLRGKLSGILRSKRLPKERDTNPIVADPASIKGICGVSPQVQKILNRPSTAPQLMTTGRNLNAQDYEDSITSSEIQQRTVATPMKRRIQSVRNNLEKFHIERVTGS